MPTYPIDLEPEQIVKWLVAEQKATPAPFKIDARRTTEVRNIPTRAEFHLGDEEREDMSEVATLATLEVAPALASEGWVLNVVVEDEAGPRAPNRGDGFADEAPIDLSTFYHQYIRNGRGIATASAEVQDAAGERHLKRLLDAMMVNRHGEKPSTKRSA